MTCLVKACSVLLLAFGVSSVSFASDKPLNAEYRAFWAEVTRTVKEGDFEAYKELYDEDAVLVSGGKNNSYPIAKALSNWRQGFIDTKTGKLSANVDFKITQSRDSSTTSHQTGMFHYYTVSETGKRTDSYAYFEALLIKKNGWKMLMEFQKAASTVDEWSALPVQKI